MPLEEPSWWYGEHKGLRQTIATAALKPFGALYGIAVRHRINRASPFVAGLPVICIGNFTAGGTGKTPTAIYIAGLLRALGETPAFLSRGFGGALTGPHWVNLEVDSATEVGDEPLLLAATAPTMIAKDRAAGAQTIAQTAPGHPKPTVIIMDDGLQNPSLHKDLSIAVVDGRRRFGNNCVIPAGPLRAPLAFQLPLVDAIIINSGSDELLKGKPVANTMAQLQQDFHGPLFTAQIKAAGDTGWLSEKPVLAFAGIGAPSRFFTMLERLGADVIGRQSFKDHHAYTGTDSENLLQQATAAKAQLVTTQKDLVRLTDKSRATTTLKATARALPITLQLARLEEQKLVALLSSMIARKTAGNADRDPGS